MSEPAQDVLNAALKLPVPERAQVAAELLASLDGESDADVEEAWAAEIERRVERIRTGKATGRPWSQVRDDLQRRK
jgi:putative addiction module component (TIGR02574 family)